MLKTSTWITADLHLGGWSMKLWYLAFARHNFNAIYLGKNKRKLLSRNLCVTCGGYLNSFPSNDRRIHGGPQHIRVLLTGKIHQFLSIFFLIKLVRPHLGSPRKIHEGQKFHTSFVLAEDFKVGRYVPKARPPTSNENVESFWKSATAQSLEHQLSDHFGKVVESFFNTHKSDFESEQENSGIDLMTLYQSAALWRKSTLSAVSF